MPEERAVISWLSSWGVQAPEEARMETGAFPLLVLGLTAEMLDEPRNGKLSFCVDGKLTVGTISVEGS